MKKYLLITSDKYKFEITESQKLAIMQAINRGDKLLEIQDSVISLAITPTIIEVSRWIAQENERLRLAGKRLCKKCNSIMEMETGCTCWDKLGGEDKNPIMLPDSVKAQLARIAESKALPQTQGEPVAYLEAVESLGPDYTIDEDGVKMYS